MTLIGTMGNTAQVYSQTLFELAGQERLVDTVQKDLNVLANLITAEKDFLIFMTSPNFEFEQKQRLIQKICAGFENLTLNFLKTVLAHNRISLLPYIIEKYEKLYQDSLNFFNIQLTVSQALGRSELEAVKTALAAAMNNKDITLEVKVDSSILGGAVIRYNDKVIDNSIRNRLHQAVETIMTRGKNRGKIYET
ncbi:MAG: ATP synthase F1 subunit delta [Sedimentisphaerales bacterium]